MHIDDVRQLLDSLPDRTEYEFKNFEMESQGSWHRQARYALLQFEQLTDQLAVLHAEMELLELRFKRDADPAIAALQEKKINAERSQQRRTAKQLQQRLSQVTRWLDTYGREELDEMVTSFESSESDSWSETIGRNMGVELLAESHAAISTMSKAALLPLADYKKSVLITNQFANFLRKTAENVERTLAPNKTQGMSSDRDS